MMRISRTALLFAPLLVCSCEDGPELVFTPYTGEPAVQNGYDNGSDPWVQDGDKGFDDTGGDSVGRARFCDEAEATAQVQEMVVKPIIPDVSVGGVPLWGADGGAYIADSLIGRPSDGKLCDPTDVYLDAYTWGPTQEVIVFFNEQTRLVEGVIAYTQYLGTMEGDYTNEAGEKVHVLVKPRERLTVGGRALDRYSNRADAPNRADSWLNPANVTALYKMVRETYFNADPFPDDFDCVATALCDLIYTGSNESIPQDTFIIIQDSGVQIRFSPEGHAQFVYLVPVRAAPFEASAEISFGQTAAPEMDFTFQSSLRPSCSINLDDRITWRQFQERCIDAGDDRTLARVNYNVEDSRDAVQVEFNGMDLGFIRRVIVSGVLRDGERPGDDDVLYSLGFTRTLAAEVEEFRPRTIGLLYKRNLEARLKASIVASSTIAASAHPIYNFAVSVPFTSDAPQRIGELVTPTGTSWVPEVLAAVRTTYRSLTPAQREVVDVRILDDIYLIEPFVDAVLEVFTHGEANGPQAFKAFRTTDDRRWSIGSGHFTRNDQQYRVQVQYSLNFGAVTAVFVERGGSQIDEVLNTVNARYGGVSPYYSIFTSRNNPYNLGGDAVTVRGFDRQLGTLDVTIPWGTGGEVNLTVSGDPMEDFSGYRRQIRGARYEFIPADAVRLYGKETLLLVYVRADGTIGRVVQPVFKGQLPLCTGLPIRYGDDVRQKLTGWSRTVSENTYRDCELVFNYSDNGNVLNEIVSLANRTAFTVIDGRAVTAAIWE